MNEMKKFYFIATALLITLGACTNDESAPEQNEITFKSYAQKSTRAGFYGPMTTSTYEVTEHFGVFAFLNTGTTTAPVWATYKFMNNVEIQRTGAASPYVWKNATITYYWPSTGSLTFACYSPYGFKSNGQTDANVVSATVAEGIKFTAFEAPTDNAKQIDLMVEDVIKDKSSQSAAIGVIFKHILSQIKFTAATTVNFLPTTDNVENIVINSIKVHKLNTVGTYSSTDGTVTNGDWDNLGTEVTYEIPAKTVNLDMTSVTVNNPLLIIPQNAQGYSWNDGTANRNIFEITYTITFKDGVNTNDSQKTVYVQPQETWQKGYIYTYHMLIGLNEITFAPTVVEAWENGGTNEDNL